MTIARKQRVARAFAASVASYDQAASVQDRVAAALAARLPALPARARVLEIGCGTGLFSARLAAAYPDAELTLSDIAAPMVEATYIRLSGRGLYLPLDGERPEAAGGRFALVAASLVFQWFDDLAGGLRRLAGLLVPGGRLVFATLVEGSLAEWRAAHRRLGLVSGTPAFPDAAAFPWPAGFAHGGEVLAFRQPYADAAAFLHSLRALGAATPAAGHRPLGPGNMRRLVADSRDGLTITYRVLLGEVTAP